MNPIDPVDPSYIGTEFVDDYKLFSNINCFPFSKLDNICTTQIDDKINKKRYNQSIITFNDKINDSKNIDIVENTNVLKLNDKIIKKIDDKLINYDDKNTLKQTEKIINYLIEPNIKKYRNNDLGFIFRKIHI